MERNSSRFPSGSRKEREADWHPRKHHGILSRIQPEVKRVDIGGPKSLGRLQQLGKIHAEGQVDAYPQGHRPHLPQAEHRLASSTDPAPSQAQTRQSNTSMRRKTGNSNPKSPRSSNPRQLGTFTD